MKTYKFQVEGMHCRSCVILTESQLQELPEVKGAKASLKDFSVEVTGEFGDKEPLDLAQELSAVLKPHGYQLLLQSKASAKKWSEFKIAGPIALGFALLFVLLQKMGIVNLVSIKEVSYGTAFVIGLIASLSSCAAVVGGLLLSMSATFASSSGPESSGKGKMKPIFLFHAGRIAAFFILGGLIGLLGANFQLSAAGTFVIAALIGVVMLILGINLLDVFHFTKKLAPSMPKFISKRALSISKLNYGLTPLLVGVATFFLPCGFTQSMQIYTLGTGSFLSGAFTMLSFAIGTLPVLALISFGSFSLSGSRRSGIFFKAAGLIVIIFAIFNLINALAVAGLIRPVFSF